MIRPLFKSDMEQVLAIENSVHVVPWTDDTFKLCADAGYKSWVAEIEHSIQGFIVASLAFDECHILNLGVGREYQRQGVGTTLLTHVLGVAKQQGIGIAYLEVRRSNVKAISLYRKMDFHMVGERADYYPTVGGHEDALIFAKSLIEEIP